MINERLQEWGRAQARRVARWLRWTGLTPNMLTVLGLGLNCLVAVVLAVGHLFWGGVLVLLAGLFDLLDGAMARVTGRITSFGSFLDSTLDRYSEGAMYLGLAAYFAANPGPAQRWLIIATVAALAGSLLVSYVRARAQSLGFTCETGLFARPERVVLTVAGLIFGGIWLAGVVVILAVLTNLTALQRIREVWLQGRAQRLAREREARAVKGGQPAKP